MSRLVAVAAFAALFALQSHRPAAAADDADEPFRVMTFNIRYDNPSDGENSWPKRKDKVASMVTLYEADIVGMQEALRRQIDDLAERLPNFAWMGVGRQDGKNGGEFTPIFYRRDRFEVLDKGDFWLSPTPDVAGSRGWDAALPRIATWAKFTDKHTGQPFFVFNTHFDHMGRTARLESAKLLRKRAIEMAKDHAVIVMGDLNCTASSPPYLWLVGKEPLPPAGQTTAARQSTSPADAPAADSKPTTAANALTDAMTVSRRPHHGPTTTWNGFQAIIPARKIDHILIHGPVVVEQHAVLADHWDGRFPSDHLPVLAEVRVTQGR
jgi:endonuclease/exonuclease/phosphatase family metal-dependent hydrolase